MLLEGKALCGIILGKHYPTFGLNNYLPTDVRTMGVKIRMKLTAHRGVKLSLKMA